MTVDALLIGTGEYTTGYVHGAAANSDKGAGVVGLTMFDLRRLGIVDQIRIAGTSGRKFPGIRDHLDRVITQKYRDFDVSMESFPDDDVESDPHAYRQALEKMPRGSVVTIFTPDDTHFEIALQAIEAGCHVLVAKPLVKTVSEHQQLIEAARRANVLVAVELHKRWDPIYTDAKDRIRNLGEFSFYSSYMSQPKTQLDTFRNWAGKSSDISYYLNSHHIDFHAWAIGHRARPISVTASAATGVALEQGIDTEDTITLLTTWEDLDTKNRGTAIYVSSWIAAKSDVHSQQRFFYMGHRGEVSVDQAHRGYSIADDAHGFASPNPLFMKYAPDAEGRFIGQSGYGYRSIDVFVRSALALNQGEVTYEQVRRELASVEDTLMITAILEAGRRSLDAAGKPIALQYDASEKFVGLADEVRNPPQTLPNRKHRRDLAEKNGLSVS